MGLTNEELVAALDSVISIPLIPFSGREIDFEGHARNIDYLMKNNHLADGRPRVISIAGTSLIHHVTPADQVRLIEVAGQQMGSDGVLIAAVLPNPIGTAGELVSAMSELPRPPDAFLLMPLAGTYNPDGLYESFAAFAQHHGETYGARFLYYYRRKRDKDAINRLMQDSPHFVGVKIGTDVSDVAPFVRALPDDKIVIWGIGDRSTDAAESGAKGHTSGINVFVSKASDAINDAQRSGDYAGAREIEAQIAPLEEIRFMNERAYNYAAVQEVIAASGVTDVVAGNGGPFNSRVPDNIAKEIKAIARDLIGFH